MEKKINFSVKKARLRDIPYIVKIHKKCVLEKNAKFYSKAVIREWINQISEKAVKNQFKNSLWYILKIGNKTIGFTQFSFKEKVLYQINIEPKYQNKGLGKFLYKFAENKFRKNHIKTISLNSTLNALRFYKSLGFKSSGKIKFKLNKTHVEMIKMQKNIK